MNITETRCVVPQGRTDGLARRGFTRVLIADDSEDTADSLAFLLDGHDTEIRVVFDGADALRVFKEFRPDVCLLDIGMPGMDGCELARAIRSHQDGAQPLLIALSGYTRTIDVERALDAGFDQHCAKPPTAEDLTGIVDRVRERRPA